MIFDSDVMIWVLRGNESAAKLVEYTKKRGISILTQLELFQGVKNREELKLIKSLFYDFDFIIYPLNENIGHRAAVYSEAFGLSHGLCTVDSLIAASVIEHNEILCTANTKHFRLIPNLEIKTFKPKNNLQKNNHLKQ